MLNTDLYVCSSWKDEQKNLHLKVYIIFTNFYLKSWKVKSCDFKVPFHL